VLIGAKQLRYKAEDVENTDSLTVCLYFKKQLVEFKRKVRDYY